MERKKNLLGTVRRWELVSEVSDQLARYRLGLMTCNESSLMTTADLWHAYAAHACQVYVYINTWG
jgi:hypothetical protein